VTSARASERTVAERTTSDHGPSIRDHAATPERARPIAVAPVVAPAVDAATPAQPLPSPTTEKATPATEKATLATEKATPATEKASPTTEKATPDAGPATAGNDTDEDTDPPLSKADDGSNEDDRTPPPEPAAMPRRDAPAIRSVADARTLIRRGDLDGALAGLYRLRRGRPTPSASKSSEIAALIGHLYFDRKWWTDALREYRFAIALDGRARRDETLVNNTVRALSERTTYPRARRVILDYVGRNAAPALKRASKSGPTPALRRRAQKVLATIESKSYRPRR